MVTKKGLVFIIALLGVVPLFYNSCSSSHDAPSDASSLNKNSCGDMSEVFSHSYYPFVKKNCATCHVPGGLGKGSFADSNFTVAWKSFEVTGYSKISEYAVNPSHQSPYTGPQHEAEIADLREVWALGLEEAAKSCQDPTLGVEEDTGPRIRSKSQGINYDFANNNEEPKTLSWKLSELSVEDLSYELPSFGGARFEIQVRSGDLLGKKHYVFFQPRILGIETDLIVKSIRLKVNGKELDKRTYNAVDRPLRLGGSDTLLSAGASVAPEVSYSDVISVSFGRLEIPSEPLPNPASAPKVSFAVASSSVSESVAGGKAKITIKLDKASVRTVTTEVQVKTSPGAQPRCCIDITNENQDKVSVNRFDWDYEIKSLSATFLPGETSKDIEIIIATDDRDEGDSEVLNLELSQNGTTVAIIDDQKKSHALTIVDDDEPYTGAALTLTQLLRPGGILYVNCLGCHNSVDNEGGYDITDYHGLIENNVLIPYDVNSKAFARMNSETPGLPPMPFTGLLETAKRRAVQDWIMSGAKNN